jgi:hypothetical protein
VPVGVLSNGRLSRERESEPGLSKNGFFFLCATPFLKVSFRELSTSGMVDVFDPR